MSVTGEPGGNPVKCGRARSPTSRPGCSARSASSPRSHAARAHRRGPADRHVAVGGRARALDLGDRRAVVDRQRAAAARLRAPPDRALPGAAHARTATSPSAATTRSCGSGCARRSGAPDLPGDPRFATNADRMANRPELVAELEPALAARDTARLGRRAARGGRARRPDPRLRAGGRRPAHAAHVRWWWRWSTPKPAPSTGSASRSSSAPRRARSAAPRRCSASTPTRSWPSSAMS